MLSDTVATSHMELLSTGNVASVTKKLHFIYYYFLSSTPISANPFKILSITGVISFSPKVLSFALNTIEYAKDLYPSPI